MFSGKVVVPDPVNSDDIERYRGRSATEERTRATPYELRAPTARLLAGVQRLQPSPVACCAPQLRLTDEQVTPTS